MDLDHPRSKFYINNNIIIMENEIKFIFQKKLLIFGIDAVGKSALISAIGRSDMKDENKSEDSK